jgi:hypothetical protein
MNPKVQNLLKNISLNTPAPIDKISEVESKIGKSLPDDYKNFLLISNGGEGEVGEEGYVQLWQVEEILELNQSYGFDKHAPGLLIIGSNGGGFNYGIDLRKDETMYIMIDPVSMTKDIFSGGNSFEELLEKIGRDDLDRISY